MASRSVLGALCAAFLLALGANVAAAAAQSADYLGGLRPRMGAEAFMSAVATQVTTEHLGRAATHVYSHALSGFSAHLSFAAAARLARDPRVSAVVPDAQVDAADDPADASADAGSSPGPTASSSPT